MEEQIAAFLKNAHPQRPEDTAAVIASADLFREGWLDSLLQLRLLTYLEQEFHIRIPAFQASLATFRTVGTIAALVQKLQKAGPIA